MSPISSLQTSPAQHQDSSDHAVATADRLRGSSQQSKGDAKSTFQDFVAGTFYKEMLKSLHKMHSKPAYFYGGNAEKVFQGQLDQQIGEDLARSHGSQLSDGLYEAFLHNQRA